MPGADRSVLRVFTDLNQSTARLVALQTQGTYQEKRWIFTQLISLWKVSTSGFGCVGPEVSGMGGTKGSSTWIRGMEEVLFPGQGSGPVLSGCTDQRGPSLPLIRASSVPRLVAAARAPLAAVRQFSGHLSSLLSRHSRGAPNPPMADKTTQPPRAQTIARVMDVLPDE